MDVFTKKKRSRIMRAIKSRDTKPELAFREILKKAGLRLRSGKKPKGSPDFVVGRTAIFIHGCFWHGCKKHFRMPKSNIEYWQDKIEKNKARDSKGISVLRKLGYRVLVFWEHEFKDAGKLKLRLACLR